MEVLPQILLVLLLIALNAYFVASEFALVAVRKTRMEELAKKGNRAAKLVKNTLSDLDMYISSTQLGITIASIALGWVGEPIIAGMFESFFTFLPDYIASISSHTLAIVIGFSVITFLHIVLGELIPKTIALQTPEKTSLIIVAPLIAFTTLFRPFIWILNITGQILLRIVGFSVTGSKSIAHSEEEIKMILNQSAASGVIARGEAQMAYGAFKLGEIPAKQIMVPRTEIIALNVNSSLKDVIKKIKRNTHSRFPVYENSVDSIIGFVHIKDIYKAMLKTNMEKKLTQIHVVRRIISVPETKRADEVLFDMRKKRVHLAVVNDEYGGTAGIVTLEDIIEGLVGEIEDEFDTPVKEIRKQPDGSFLVDGRVSIERMKDTFNFPLRGQGYTTIGGLVFGLLGHEPTVGATVQIGNMIFIVHEIEKNRIKTIRIQKEKRARKVKKKKKR